MSKLTSLPVWQALKQHHRDLERIHLRELTAALGPRQLVLPLAGANRLTLDYAKNRINGHTLELLSALADACQLRLRIEELFSGAKVNYTEERPALHTALRCAELPDEVRALHEQMAAWVQALTEGSWCGDQGQPFTDVVHIGIGGSDLGLRLAVQALQSESVNNLRLHLVANVDGDELNTIFQQVNPATTLFIVTSKSFTTTEVLCNARTAQTWLRQVTENIAPHFIAITGNESAAREFGIDPARILPIWDWVGGRYSIWSAAGFPLALKIGMQNFQRFLAGAQALDQHFREQPWLKNIPALLALLDVWNINFCGANNLAILPYVQRLQSLPQHLQQLIMESNGKTATRSGEKADYSTAPLVWGGVGTNCQHAFFQLMLQGTVLTPADFIAVRHLDHTWPEHQRLLVAAAMAQTQALLQGREQAAGLERAIAGNQPSNLIWLEKLTPESLGALLALYEHRVFAQSVMWDINAFDQWGVELGKQLVQEVLLLL